MWWRRNERFWRIGFIRQSKKRFLFLFWIFLFVICGCGSKYQTEYYFENDAEEENTGPEERNNDSGLNGYESVAGKEGTGAKSEDIAGIYQKVYEETSGINSPDPLEKIRNIIEKLGEHGIVAVDEENQVDMAGAEEALEFCKSVDEKEKAELTILVPSYLGGFTKYELKTEDGNVDVVKDNYQYENKDLRNISTVSFQADSFAYTEEGYLLFGGSCYFEDYYVLELADIQECAALRVQPLEEACRELNRQYILPVGYRENNLFLTDWSEKDFKSLNFYDMFDRLYPIVYGQPLPYTADENLNVGAVYQITEQEFEGVIQAYFQIDIRELRMRTTYFSADKAYEYKPRGFYENEYPDIPYPEVTGYQENADGTITLTVNAVYPEEYTSKDYAHELVVRPFPDGSFQYVSNSMLSSKEAYESWWHAERLTEEEWEEMYSHSSFDSEE